VDSRLAACLALYANTLATRSSAMTAHPGKSNDRGGEPGRAPRFWVRALPRRIRPNATRSAGRGSQCISTDYDPDVLAECALGGLVPVSFRIVNVLRALAAARRPLAALARRRRWGRRRPIVLFHPIATI
jgi:hypothetical protein